MMKSLTAGACALALTTTLAFAQTSQPQGGAAQSPTSPTADTMKKNNAKKETTGMATGHSNKDSMKDGMKTDKDGMKK